MINELSDNELDKRNFIKFIEKQALLSSQVSFDKFKILIFLAKRLKHIAAFNFNYIDKIVKLCYYIFK